MKKIKKYEYESRIESDCGCDCNCSSTQQSEQSANSEITIEVVKLNKQSLFDTMDSLNRLFKENGYNFNLDSNNIDFFAPKVFPIYLYQEFIISIGLSPTLEEIKKAIQNKTIVKSSSGCC